MSNIKKDIQDPKEALSILMEGNQRFISNIKVNRDYLKEVEATKDGQSPFAVVISCMDSRTSVELVFDQGIGDIFSIRIAGNIVTTEIIASCEYACHVVGSCLILVLGHSGCGAIRGAVDKVNLGHLHTIFDRINDSVSVETHDDLESKIRLFTEDNVKAGMLQLSTKSEIIRDLVNQNKLMIIGGVYDVANGTVQVL